MKDRDPNKKRIDPLIVFPIIIGLTAIATLIVLLILMN